IWESPTSHNFRDSVLVALPVSGDLFICAKDLFDEATASPQTWGGWLIQDRFAANPEKAHTRDAPRASTTSGMPRAMLAHTPRVAQGFGAGIRSSNDNGSFASVAAISSSVASAGNTCNRP